MAKPIKIDGKLDEAAWKDAPSTGLFVNTLTGAPADHKTEAKLLWDNDNLYLAFENADTDVWSTLTKRDDKLWTQEAVEMMIDADRNGKTYVEFQVRPTGDLFDTYLPEWRKYENDLDPKRKPYDWNSKAKASGPGARHAQQAQRPGQGLAGRDGDPAGRRQRAGQGRGQAAPQLGDSWRLNMFRMDSPEGKPQRASAWSPPLTGDFHALDKFGEIVFADEKGQVPGDAGRGPGQGRPEPHAAMREAISAGMAAGAASGEAASPDLKKKAALRKRKVARENDR